MTLSCRSTAAFGVEVVPLVKSWIATAPGSSGGSAISPCGAGVACSSCCASAQVIPAGNFRRARWAGWETSHAGAIR